MKTKAIIYTLIVFILFSSVQNLYAQNPVSNSTLQLETSSKLKVVSSFFPIDQFVGQVGGEAIERMLLIPKGVEPHDYEPTIKDIQRVDSADVLVYNGLGFENWIGKMSIPQKIDASKGLNATYLDERNMTFDPHVWLDPLLAKKQVENIRDGLIMNDPNHKDIYVNNSNNFLNELDNLDEKIRTDLESCKKKDFITFHNSFSYFAKQYGLNQHSISNTDPESEVTPARLTEIINIAKTLGLQVIYSEELVDPRQATVIAQEVPDGKVLVLSPIEGLSENEQKAGLGYIDKMNDNIDNLMAGLQCNQ
ncbi:MAG TPA: zinc ABC transporter substrate-binding protein [Nitrososphaeraceae archaeon]|nr:zinc ABC transporter substrate-binding protein [Nitrososphaeraceae archaeon]